MASLNAPWTIELSKENYERVVGRTSVKTIGGFTITVEYVCNPTLDDRIMKITDSLGIVTWQDI